MSEVVKLTEKPSYYAVIPAAVRYDKLLSPNAKLLYGEITCLLNFNNKCFASNEYFARLYDISEIQISRLISQLVSQHHIVTLMENTAKGSQRIIKLGLNINDKTPINKNVKGGLNKNVKHNIHSTNNNSLFENKECDLFSEFIETFNKIRKSNFKPLEKLRKVFAQRIKHYSKDDILHALTNAMGTQHHIDNKFNDLTPEFILREDKLEKYINYNSKKESQVKEAPAPAVIDHRNRPLKAR